MKFRPGIFILTRTIFGSGIKRILATSSIQNSLIPLTLVSNTYISEAGIVIAYLPLKGPSAIGVDFSKLKFSNGLYEVE